MQESAADDYVQQWAAKIVGVCSPDEVQAMVDRYQSLADDPEVDQPCRIIGPNPRGCPSWE